MRSKNISKRKARRLKNTIRGYRNKALTLLEVVVCLLILSLISAIVAYPIGSMIRQYRFERSCSELALELLSTKRMALLHEGKMEVSLEQTEKGLVFARWTDEAIEKDRRYFFLVKTFPDIESCAVNNQAVGKQYLTFTPWGKEEFSFDLKRKDQHHSFIINH